MRMRRWLEWNFVKETFSNLFWNFHYITIFGLFTLVIGLGILTIGPALIALCRCTRLIAQDCKVTIKDYFTGIKEFLLPGLVLSGCLIVGGLSLRSSMIILSMDHFSSYEKLSYLAIFIIIVLSFFILYYPFAALNEKNIIGIFKKSAAYAALHTWDTLVQVSFMVILWKILLISPAVAAILFLPLGTYFINRFILANNEEIDKNINLKFTK